MYKGEKRYQWRVVAAGTAMVVALSSCATTGGSGAGGENMGKMLGTLGGAAIGAAVGGATGGKYNPLIGAAIGAAVGYAAGYAFDSYRVSQKKDAAEVNDEYRKEHGGHLPAETMVTKYETKTEPSGLVNRGEKLDIVSEVELVKGANSIGKDRVDEELMISDASGKNTKKLRKQALSDTNVSGAYLTRFTFRPTEDVAQGTYPFKTVLYLNDEPVRESEGKIQVVRVGQELKVAILE
ncbi:glycine zipper domain-containing protein [Nitrosospira briensis]|uniref:glycine zipper domain-containing protein n=1 Tax=Nitrosospira briensis TaxID=35799 RepID=UPI0008F0D5B6|nr:glycine zipper domain-containing protein [Nitrosospira briensis]SFO11317.1 Glycine zipper [Nitrosospira briensis]